LAFGGDQLVTPQIEFNTKFTANLKLAKDVKGDEMLDESEVKGAALDEDQLMNEIDEAEFEKKGGKDVKVLTYKNQD